MPITNVLKDDPPTYISLKQNTNEIKKTNENTIPSALYGMHSPLPPPYLSRIV
jgi:hypothetical protein